MNKQVIKSEMAPAPIGPYSQAVSANGFLFISGQIALNADTGQLITNTIEAEARQVMNNLKSILNAGGLDFSNVVKTTIFLKNMDDFTKVNAVYGGFFSSDPPARETVQVAKLPKDVQVEISMVAVYP